MNGLIIDSLVKKKWKWVAAQTGWLRLIKQSKPQFISALQTLEEDYISPTFETVIYRAVKFYILGKYIHLWVPDSVPVENTEEYVYKQILNRSFLKALNEVE